jgi:hypothetical protein
MPWLDYLNKLLPHPLLFWFVVGILAVYRISSIMVDEKIAAPFRHLLGVEVSIDGILIYPDTFFGALISCFRCTSVWVAFGCIVLFLTIPVLLLPFAVSAGAVMIDEVIFSE